MHALYGVSRIIYRLRILPKGEIENSWVFRTWSEWDELLFDEQEDTSKRALLIYKVQQFKWFFFFKDFNDFVKKNVFICPKTENVKKFKIVSTRFFVMLSFGTWDIFCYFLISYHTAICLVYLQYFPVVFISFFFWRSVNCILIRKQEYVCLC